MMQRQLSSSPDAKLPILIAGDIFDKHSVPAETVNFALHYLPDNCYAVPGQHDLQNHSYRDIHKSSYYTLVKSGKVTNLHPGKPEELYGTGVRLWGFPWGTPVKPLAQHNSSLGMDIAVIHSYIWTKRTGYPGAPEEKRLNNYLENLSGFRIAVFGDNHSGFLSEGSEEETTIINNGCLLRRKRDEIPYKPAVGIIHMDGSVSREYLDTSQDRFLESEETAKVLRADQDYLGFVDELNALGDTTISFEDAVLRALERVRPRESVRELVLESLEKRGKQ
jgi:hypothetical protein